MWPLLVALAGLAPMVVGAAEPRAVIDELQRGLTELAAVPGLAFGERMERLEPLLAATHDIPYIARFTVGRHWAGFDADQQQAFTAAFERLSLATYAARFARLTPGALEVVSADPPGEARATVQALIHRSEAPAVPMEYVLHSTEQGWRIINIVADGVSDLALKRAEYQGLLAAGGITELMAALDRQIGELERALPGQPTNR